MRVAVLGSGVVGVASAWFLAEAGHEVTVVDRQAGAALETSFANGGQVSASHAEPWASPATLRKVFKWLGRRDAPLLFHWRLDPALWAWGLRFLRNCTEERARINTERTLRVALYSRSVLRELRAATGLHYDERQRGILHVYRDPREYEQALAAAETMRAHGLERRPLDPAACVDLEPALSDARSELVGGLYSPDDENGDAHKFARGLADLCAGRGVAFRFGTRVHRLSTSGGRVSAAETDGGTIEADAFVAALGSYTPLLVRPLGLRLPVYPAKGYSVTIPTGGSDGAPQVSITDDEHKLVFSRLGDRLRVAGTAELAGYDTGLDERRARLVLRGALNLFPRCGAPERAEFWTGLRPNTPDSVPILGRTAIPNLFLNTGHGTLGWTMSCGSGRIVADLVSGRTPDIDLDGLGLDRFG